MYSQSVMLSKLLPAFFALVLLVDLAFPHVVCEQAETLEKLPTVLAIVAAELTVELLRMQLEVLMPNESFVAACTHFCSGNIQVVHSLHVPSQCV